MKQRYSKRKVADDIPPQREAAICAQFSLTKTMSVIIQKLEDINAKS